MKIPPSQGVCLWRLNKDEHQGCDVPGPGPSSRREQFLDGQAPYLVSTGLGGARAHGGYGDANQNSAQVPRPTASMDPQESTQAHAHVCTVTQSHTQSQSVSHRVSHSHNHTRIVTHSLTFSLSHTHTAEQTRLLPTDANRTSSLSCILRNHPCGMSGGILETNHPVRSILIFPSGGAKMSFNKRGD